MHTLQLVYNLLLSLKLSRGHAFFSLTSLDFAEVYPLWSFWLAAPWKSFGVGKPMEPLHGCVDLRERIHSESDCHDGLMGKLITSKVWGNLAVFLIIRGNM